MKEFFDNVWRYPRYLIALMLGIIFAAFGRLTPLFQKPTTAIAIVGMLLGGGLFLVFTLKAMLGMNMV